MKTVNCPEVCSNVTSRMIMIRSLHAMATKLCGESGAPFSPFGNATNNSVAMIAAKPAKQP